MAFLFFVLCVNLLKHIFQMEDILIKLIDYFEQQLRLQQNSQIKYTGEEAYFDAVDICKNSLRALRQSPVNLLKHNKHDL